MGTANGPEEKTANGRRFFVLVLVLVLVLECFVLGKPGTGLRCRLRRLTQRWKSATRFQIEHEDDWVAAMPLCDFCALLLKIPGFRRGGFVCALTPKTAESQNYEIEG